MTAPTRRREPHPAQGAMLDELRAVTKRIDTARDGLAALYEERSRVVLAARELDPPPTRVELAEALSLSDAMLSKLLRDIGATRKR